MTQLHEDVLAAFEEARQREGGAVRSGPNRYYVSRSIPSSCRGFVDLVTHPWVTTVAETVLGHDYEIVEIGFDIPFARAMDQPGAATSRRRRRRTTSTGSPH